MTAMQEKLFIDGLWVAPPLGGRLPVVDPAVKAARMAFDEGVWPRYTGAHRARFLRAIADRVREKKDFLARLEVRYNGKPLPEAAWDITSGGGRLHHGTESLGNLTANHARTG
jgi:betaine-aldehyde dehydrogenase